MLGFFVGLLGFVIGFLTKKGYEILGGKPGRLKPWIIILVIIICVILGQFVANSIDMHQALQDEGYIGYTMFDLPIMVWEYFSLDEEYRGFFIKDIAMGLVFAFLGIFDILRSLNSEIRGNRPKTKKL